MSRESSPNFRADIMLDWSGVPEWRREGFRRLTRAMIRLLHHSARVLGAEPRTALLAEAGEHSDTLFSWQNLPKSASPPDAKTNIWDADHPHLTLDRNKAMRAELSEIDILVSDLSLELLASRPGRYITPADTLRHLIDTVRERRYASRA